MDQATTFYQVLTTASFTLLGIWVGVMQFAHGGWRTDPARHATTLHVTLKFFLPGVVGLASLLGSAGSGGLVWRVTFMLGGLAGAAESVHFLLRGAARPAAIRRLALVDPLLYLAMVTVAFVPGGVLAVTPLQAEGMATGLVFVTGLLGVWIALSEQAAADDPAPAPVRTSRPPERPVHPGSPAGLSPRRPAPSRALR
jgi:hypothetical protein